MRDEFCTGLVRRAAADPDFVFLTGDLGYKALEPLRDAAGERFLNAGIAEQNMVSVAAGLASAGLHPWAYSIAPFLYARAYEQIRNDVCFHRLPVRLVGNGGGYGYGVMGATHHALEDYGALLCLPEIRAFVPAFGEDVTAILDGPLAGSHYPAYLRLGRDEKPVGFTPPAYAPWRRLLVGGGATVLVGVGPLIGPILGKAAELPHTLRPSIWAVTELPITPAGLPVAFLEDVRAAECLVVVEEHVAPGGAGQALLAALYAVGTPPRAFTHHTAQGYPSGRYGSQAFHRRESGLDADTVLALLARNLDGDDRPYRKQ